MLKFKDKKNRILFENQAYISESLSFFLPLKFNKILNILCLKKTENKALFFCYFCVSKYTLPIVKIIDKYIFKEALIAVFFSIALFVFVLVVGNALRDVVALLAGGKIAFSNLLELVYFLILYVIVYALPMGVLMGVLIVMGRLSAEQELVALKSIGLSIYRIAVPIFLIGILGTILSLVVNFYYAPKAKANYRHMIANVFKNQPLQYLKPNTFIYDFPGYILYIDEKQDKVIDGFWMWSVDAEKRIRYFLKAKRAHFDYDKETQVLSLNLHQAMTEEYFPYEKNSLESAPQSHLAFKEWNVQLSLNDFLSKNRFYKKLSMFTLKELMEEKRKHADNLTEYIKIAMQIQKSFAIAFSVLIFSILAIPLGVKISRKETYANAAIAVILGLLYHVFFACFTWLERYPSLHPQWLIWIPNLLYLWLACFLLKKINQH